MRHDAGRASLALIVERAGEFLARRREAGIVDDIAAAVRAVETQVVASGAAWVSSVALRGRVVLRACITSYESTQADVAALVDVLEDGTRALPQASVPS